MRRDSDAKVYLLGSVAEKNYLLISDIDVLATTEINPKEVLESLWRK